MKGVMLMSYEILSLNPGDVDPLFNVICGNVVCDCNGICDTPDIVCCDNTICLPIPQNPRCDAIGGGCATSVGGDRPNR